ncbi:hypothetical protein ACFXAF_12460 [Kitasatospora sp. NPDC059463]|uniref:hypothetical protein n=1 Tax=unclassified Kitasatospora TaxID=2633591 RepID=UPI00369B13DA
MNALAVLAATAPVAVAGLAVLGRSPAGPAGSDFPDTRTAATHSGLIPGSSPVSTPQQPYLDLDAVRRRADAATPGPWHIEEDRHDLVRRVTDTSGTLDINLGYLGNRTLADAEFIAHARTDLPTLMDRQDYLRAALNETALGRAHAEDAADSLRARLHPTHIDEYRNAQEQPANPAPLDPADVPRRLVAAEALIDAAETRPLTAWEAEEVRSLARAVRGNIRREAQLTRYGNAWRSARYRAAHQRSVLADHRVEVSTLRARISAVEAALHRYVGCASTTATALRVEVDAALHPTTGTIPPRSPHPGQPEDRTAPAARPAPRHPTPAALDKAARRRLDHLIRRASRALGPAEQTTLLRLWEQHQAAAEQDRRSAAGARQASLRITDMLRDAQDQLLSYQAVLALIAEYRAATGARLRRTTAAYESTILEARRQARRADSTAAVLGEILRRVADRCAATDPAPTASDLAAEITSLVSLHAVLDTAGIDVTGDLAPARLRAALDRVTAPTPTS